MVGCGGILLGLLRQAGRESRVRFRLSTDQFFQPQITPMTQIRGDVLVSYLCPSVKSVAKTAGDIRLALRRPGKFVVRLFARLLPCVLAGVPVFAQAPAASRVFPNLAGNIERPLRYRPDGADFVIENGAEFFNRPLYGGNTAFRVDGGDKPEFVLYLPGRGGNLRLGVRSANRAKWLHAADRVVMRYRPGSLHYEIRDPLLGPGAVLRLTALAYDQTEGLIVRAEAEGVAAGVELIWAYGGSNGQRGSRDGDIGTERVPISEWFQLQPEFCRDNVFELGPAGFTLQSRAATIVGIMPAGAQLTLGDAAQWNDPAALLETTVGRKPDRPVVVGRVALANGRALVLSLQRLTATAAVAEELETYKAVTSERAGVDRRAPKFVLPPAYAAAELPQRLAEAESHFARLRTRVAVDTPDPYINAAAGALNVAADAVWDEPEGAIMHGAIAWRTKLLGWRGPSALDALGWHDRARQNITYWIGRQNLDAIPDKIPPASEKDNLARNEAGLHGNGDLSNSHYDMNVVFIDAVFRHLLWTGDTELTKNIWPVLERHLAWERRLFRREFGPAKLPLYEAYAVIWASDDLGYGGGGTAHASAYNFFHHRMAARIARLVGADPAPYEQEAALIARAMRELLWLPERGWFAESKDLLGRQLVHPSAALWTFYHTMDSGVPTPAEAWAMTRQVDTQIPHLPVRGPGVPDGFHTLATSNWLPYSWSINNVVMGEAVHAALGFWQAGRGDEAFRIFKGSVLAAMFMGISPGNVGSMSYLDVYRRESQRDFADGSGVLSRALVEGLFGVRPDALAGELRLAPGFPAEWDHASLRHPDIGFAFRREGDTDVYVIEPKFGRPQSLQLTIAARRDRSAVTVNGQPAAAKAVWDGGGQPALEIAAPAAARTEIEIAWTGAAIARKTIPVDAAARPPMATSPRVVPAKVDWFSVDLGAQFNDRVTQIFQHEYRSPRSPFVSLALPKQGLGAWAGHVNETADIDDTGLRAAAEKGGGRLVLPNGVPLATPGAGEARNVVFTSQWDNFPREVSVPLRGKARQVYLLMAGSTYHMQSRIDNGEVVVTYVDGSTARLALENPTTWWPIEQDYFTDDFQFRVDVPLPTRVDLKTGRVRVLEAATFQGQGGKIPGGAATVLELPLDARKELKSLTVRALANDVVIGLMAATLAR